MRIAFLNIPAVKKIILPLLTAAVFGAGLLAAGGGADEDGQAPAAPGLRYYAAWNSALANIGSGVLAVLPKQSNVFTDRTLRQIVRVSLPAETVRIKLSNLFGTEPVTFTGVRIAKSAGASAIDPLTDTAVTFKGQASVTLAAGAETYSDDIHIAPLPARTGLAISMYFANRAVLQTAHLVGSQHAYLGNGDQLGAASIPVAMGASMVSPYFGLAAVDILSRDSTKVVVTFGDSITDGFQSSMDANRRYPDALDARLKAAGQTSTSVVNSGMSGNRWIFDGIGPNGNGRYDRDVLNVAGVTHAIVLLGINDIGQSDNPGQEVSADQIIASLSSAVAKTRSRGVKVLLGTLLPFKNAGYYSAKGESKRQAVNAWIRANKEIDAMVDFDLALRSRDDPLTLNLAYDSGDHLHPNDAGYATMAKAVDLSKLN